MAEIEDNVDRELFRNMEKLRQLRIEHRDLDEVISRLSLDLHVDELQLKRLKKRNLMLKDLNTRLESELISHLNPSWAAPTEPAAAPDFYRRPFPYSLPRSRLSSL